MNDGQVPIPAETARRIACDSVLARMVLNAKGEPIEMGRSVRTATVNQKRMLVERDGPTCVAPGCDIPVAFCEAHHLQPWQEGGRTDLANLGFVCNRHHHLCHEGGWTLSRRSDRTYDFVPPPRR